ncbi:MAG: PilN domain-containing protein [Candidatus Saccharimonadales bacterium]
MINLLPPDLKQAYRYARINRGLSHWLLAFAAAIAGVAAITAVGLVMMNHSIHANQAQITQAKARLASQNSTGIQSQVADISSNLKLMVKVLSKEILFSKLLAQLGNITPPNVILTNLSISQTDSAIDITAQTGSYNAATQLQVNLADPANQIFSKADIVNVSCASNASQTPANSKYPCTATLRALFTQNNPFLFINNVAPSKVGT